VPTAESQRVFPILGRQAAKTLCLKGKAQYLEEIVVILD
jgi:hypothetical protein